MIDYMLVHFLIAMRKVSSSGGGGGGGGGGEGEHSYLKVMCMCLRHLQTRGLLVKRHTNKYGSFSDKAIKVGVI